MKSFVITVDTEGDNLWNYGGGKVATENVRFIPRFQELCNKFHFMPVWLTNYEMIQSDDYVNYIKTVLEKEQCEVGIHVHAWNNPPIYSLNGPYNGNPYLIEYPDDIMRQKFSTTYNLIKDRLGIEVKSHRSGRWAMDERYFNLLEEFNIKVDCSYTPYVSWRKSVGETGFYGSDYRKVPLGIHKVGQITEVPVTIRHFSHLNSLGSWRHKMKSLLLGGVIWMRPAISSLKEMKRLVNVVCDEKDSDYIEFMIHSSELMPGGSPYFSSESDIDRLYLTMESLFEYVAEKGYTGNTLSNLAK